MGYFNGWSNWAEFAEYAEITRICNFCGHPFQPSSPNQRRCNQEDSSECNFEYDLEHMGPRQYLRHVGMTKKQYIAEYGLEQYNNVVINIDKNYEQPTR